MNFKLLSRKVILLASVLLPISSWGNSGAAFFDKMVGSYPKIENCPELDNLASNAVAKSNYIDSISVNNACIGKQTQNGQFIYVNKCSGTEVQSLVRAKIVEVEKICNNRNAAQAQQKAAAEKQAAQKQAQSQAKTQAIGQMLPVVAQVAGSFSNKKSNSEKKDTTIQGPIKEASDAAEKAKANTVNAKSGSSSTKVDVAGNSATSSNSNVNSTARNIDSIPNSNEAAQATVTTAALPTVDNSSINSLQDINPQVADTLKRLDDKALAIDSEKAANSLTGKIKDKARDVLSIGKKEDVPDEKTSAEIKNGDSQAEALRKQVQVIISHANAQASPQAQACNVLANKIETAVNTVYLPARKTCTKSSSLADKFCSLIRSDKAQAVQALVTIGSTVLSNINSASDSCETTSNISKIAQAGMTAAQLSCTGVKLTCDASCALSVRQQKTIVTAIKSYVDCAGKQIEVGINMQSNQVTMAQGIDLQRSGEAAQSAGANLYELLEKEMIPESDVPKAKIACKNNEANMLVMATQIAGLVSAYKDAKKCKEQLASSSSQSAVNGSTAVSTAQMCSDPANASNYVCKCTADPNAEGCLNNMATTGLASVRTNNNDGTSGMIGADNSGIKAPTGLGNVNGGLSDEAKKILGINSGDSANNSFGSAEAAGGGSGSSSSGADAGSSKSGKTAAVEKSKKSMLDFSFGDLSSGLSGLFGKGKKSGSDGKTYEDQQEQINAVKRKIASDQARSEISTASGRSNFDKVRNRYQSTNASFLGQ
ncbi:MAG: hypothetical protein ACK41T_07335 [Pseudobdellovibrio sp.]